MRTLNILSCVVLGLVGPLSGVLFADELFSQSISISSDASEREEGIAKDLAEWLKKATGKEFAVGAGSGSGSGSGQGGIVLAVDTDDSALAGEKSRDAFAVKSGPDGIRIVGRTGMALENGVYWWLDKLGFRWLHASDKWTVVPELSDLRLEIETVQAPAFDQREFFGTGGFGRPAMDPKQLSGDAWQRYKRRNLLTGLDPEGIRLGGHAGEAFVKAHEEALRANPELLAMTDGKRQDLDEPRVPIKLNVGNPELQELWVKDRLDHLRREVDRNPATLAVSVDPSDGGRHDESPESRAIGNGSPSDQIFFLANLTARAVAEEFPGKFVNLYGYNEHAEPPSFPLEENVIVSIIPYGFQTTGRTPEEFIDAWKHVAPVLGIYDYWNIPDWARNLPSLSPETVTDRIRLWHESGVTLFLAESTFSGGSMGPNWYLASRLLWDPSMNPGAILDDYYSTAFGPAAGPVRRMYDRWGGRFALSDHEVALSLRDLDEAMRLTNDPAIQSRLVDLARYTHYLGLWYEYLRTKPKTPERIQAAKAVVNYLWRVYDSRMLQVFRLAQLLNRDDAPELEELHMDNPMWADTPQLTDEEILELFHADLARYEPLDFEQKAWEGSLVPLIAEPSIQTFPSVETQRFGQTAKFQFFVSEGMESVALEIEVGKVGGRTERFDRVRVSDPEGKEVFNEKVFNTVEGWQSLKIPTAKPGLYAMEVFDQKNTFRLKLPEGLPFACTEGFTSTDLSKRTYFFVPKSTREIALLTPGVIPLKLYDPEGSEVLDSRNDAHRNLLVIDVPEGLDGKAWSFAHFKAWFPIQLLNGPNVFAWSEDTLMVPEDAR